MSARPRDAIATVNGSGAPTCSFATLPAAGSAILVWSAAWAATTKTITSVVDNQGNSYSLIHTFELNVASDFVRMGLYAAVNIGTPSGTFTVTVNMSATSDNCIVIAEYTGVELVSVAAMVDKSITATGSSTGPTATLAATDNPKDTIVGAVSLIGSTVTITEDATNLPTLVRENENNSTAQALAVAQRDVTATGTYTGNWVFSLSRNWGVILAALKDSSAASLQTRSPLPAFPKLPQGRV